MPHQSSTKHQQICPQRLSQSGLPRWFNCWLEWPSFLTPTIAFSCPVYKLQAQGTVQSHVSGCIFRRSPFTSPRPASLSPGLDRRLMKPAAWFTHGCLLSPNMMESQKSSDLLLLQHEGSSARLACTKYCIRNIWKWTIFITGDTFSHYRSTAIPLFLHLASIWHFNSLQWPLVEPGMYLLSLCYFTSPVPLGFGFVLLKYECWLAEKIA